MLGDLIREHTRDAARIDGRGHRATDAVDHQPGRELDCSWDRGAWQRRKAPGVAARIGKCNDLVLGQITRLRNARMLRQVTRCSRHNPANFADPSRDQCRVGKVGYAERDVDAFINQVHRSIEQIKPRGHCRVSVHEGGKDRSQHHFS